MVPELVTLPLEGKGPNSMMHQLVLRLVGLGGEAACWLLLAISIVSFAIASDRIWFFVRNWIDEDLFALQLFQLLRADEWPKIRALVSRSTASVCVVVTAGLGQIELGSRAMRTAIRSARLREQIRQEGQLGILAALGSCALLIGILGSLCDLMHAVRTASASAGTPEAQTLGDLLTIGMFGPVAAGLAVCIPANLFCRLLRHRTQLSLTRIDWISELLVLQFEGEEYAATGHATAQPPAAASRAA